MGFLSNRRRERERSEVSSRIYEITAKLGSDWTEKDVPLLVATLESILLSAQNWVNEDADSEDEYNEARVEGRQGCGQEVLEELSRALLGNE